MENVIHKAAAKGLVIPTERGSRNVVELYQLPLTGDYSLDTVSRDLLLRINARKQESLVVDTTGISPLDQFRLDVLTQVIADKKAEEEAAKIKADKQVKKAARRQELLEQRNNLQKESTRQMTQEEVDAELAALDADDE